MSLVYFVLSFNTKLIYCNISNAILFQLYSSFTRIRISFFDAKLAQQHYLNTSSSITFLYCSALSSFILILILVRKLQWTRKLHARQLLSALYLPASGVSRPLQLPLHHLHLPRCLLLHYLLQLLLPQFRHHLSQVLPGRRHCLEIPGPSQHSESHVPSVAVVVYIKVSHLDCQPKNLKILLE